MNDLHDLARPNVFEIDLDAIASNVLEIRRFVGSDVRIFAAMKANAYGFGLLEVAPVIQRAGVDTICVADLSDAVRLRNAGITIPILLYAGNLVDDVLVRAVEDMRLAGTVTDIEVARSYSSLARGPVRVFAKVDVGLERLGIPFDQAADVVCEVARLPNLRLDGVYTHLHVPDPAGPAEYVQWQLRRFDLVLERVRAAGVAVNVAVAASTPVVPRYGAGGLNGIDVGRLIYGSLRRDRDATGSMNIRNAFRSLRSRLIQCRPVARTAHLGEAPFAIRPGMRMGIAPIGFADGLDFLNCGVALVRGCRAPLLGGPSLEHTRLDLTEIPQARVGDEVVFVGSQEGAEITPDDVLAYLGVGQPARMATSVRESVRRMYLRSAT
ncbi:MAG: alanine racemase [Candidatus Limnocylindrales bacterium]